MEEHKPEETKEPTKHELKQHKIEEKRLEKEKKIEDIVKSKQRKKFFKYAITLIILLVIVLIFINLGSKTSSGKYDTFVQCLEDSSVKFYGSYQCPHCATQKRMFDGSLEDSPVYIECGPLGRFNDICTSAGVTAVPHWVFPDGETESGTQDLNTIAELSGCELVEDPEGQ